MQFFWLSNKFFVCLLAATVTSGSGSSNTGENTTMNDFQGTLNPSSAMMEYTIISPSSLPSHTIRIGEDSISISPSLASQNLLVSSLDPSFSQLIIFLPSPVDSVVISPLPTDTLGYTDELFSFTHKALESSTLTRVQGSSVIQEIEVTPTNIPTESIINVEYSVTDSRWSTEVPVIDTNIVSTAAMVGIALALIITVASLGLSSALLICFCCCCLQSKYEHSTGNERRMTIHQWNITSGQYMMNHTNLVGTFGSGRSRGSVQSGGSSLFGSQGFMRRHSGGSADQLSSAIHYSIPNLYSTPV